jgi:hypothetical protein
MLWFVGSDLILETSFLDYGLFVFNLYFFSDIK